MTDEITALVERLRATYTLSDEFGVFHPLCNPDGPEAATAIEKLAGECDAVLREREQLRNDCICEEDIKEQWIAIALAAEAARDAALARVAVLEGAVEAIAASGYGLQGIQEDYGHDTNAYNFRAMKYWHDKAVRYQGIARSTLTPAATGDA